VLEASSGALIPKPLPPPRLPLETNHLPCVEVLADRVVRRPRAGKQEGARGLMERMELRREEAQAARRQVEQMEPRREEARGARRQVERVEARQEAARRQVEQVEPRREEARGVRAPVERPGPRREEVLGAKREEAGAANLPTPVRPSRAVRTLATPRYQRTPARRQGSMRMRAARFLRRASALGTGTTTFLHRSIHQAVSRPRRSRCSSPWAPMTTLRSTV